MAASEKTTVLDYCHDVRQKENLFILQKKVQSCNLFFSILVQISSQSSQFQSCGVLGKYRKQLTLQRYGGMLEATRNVFFQLYDQIFKCWLIKTGSIDDTWMPLLLLHVPDTSDC